MASTGRLIVALALLADLAHAQNTQKRPFIGYLCAAGGQQGSVVLITAGGQNLRGAKRVFVSGGGVSASVIAHRRVPWLLKPDDRRVVAQRLRQLAFGKFAKRRKGKKGKPPPTMPDRPMLDNLESLTRKELRRVAYEFLDPARRSQLSPQIAETLRIGIKIDADAEIGERELRIETPQGLTNPVVFFVGSLPEFLEQEPNDYDTAPQPVLELPRVINGQVTFKDVDRFRFRATSGQKLVIEVKARKLVPYLADAVPGWFQATLALFDPRGKEISFVDDYRFDPDPVIFFEVPEDGEYTIEIRDAVYRGRDDFAYRISVAEQPFITSIFPLGGKTGSSTIAEIRGWNLPWANLMLDTAPGGPSVRRMACADKGVRTNPVSFAVDRYREKLEVEPNDSPQSAQKIILSTIINGRIARPGEVDIFRFEGYEKQEIVAEVQARRLGSPLDSVLHLIDDTGRVVFAFNDDHPDEMAGLVTHQADSYLRVKLPVRGTYYLRIGDAQGRGGDQFAYRLRISPPQPDFAILVTPASINVRRTGLVPITVHAVRKDGFDGPIQLSLKDAPKGFLLGGAAIPAGRNRIRMTLAAPPMRRVPTEPIPLEIVGRARAGRRNVTRAAVPAEDMMQAFGLRHLVPARELFVHLTRSWRNTPSMRLVGDRPMKLPLGGTAKVRIKVPGLPPLAWLELELSEPPPGIFIQDMNAEGSELVITFSADRAKAKAGYADNLIIEAFTFTADRRAAKGKKGKKKKKQGKAAKSRRVFASVLPAIPFVIVGR